MSNLIRCAATSQRTQEKKFNTRAEGKIELYKEACHIRDKAKTPNDYYSAQTIFSRIYHYEQTHPLVEKWTEPSVYAEAIKCNDSEAQMKLCEKLADEKASQLKHHSLFVSCTFIVCILQYCFSLGQFPLGNDSPAIYSHTGNYEKNMAELRNCLYKEQR